MTLAEVLVEHEYPEPARMPTRVEPVAPLTKEQVADPIGDVAREFSMQDALDDRFAGVAATIQTIPRIQWEVPDTSLVEALHFTTYTEEIDPLITQWRDLHHALIAWMIRRTMLRLDKEIKRYSELDGDPLIIIPALTYMMPNEDLGADLETRAPSIITPLSEARGLLQEMAGEYRRVDQGDYELAVGVNAIERGAYPTLTIVDPDQRQLAPSEAKAIETAIDDLLVNDPARLAFYYYASQRCCLEQALDILEHARATHDDPRWPPTANIAIHGCEATIDVPITIGPNESVPVPISTQIPPRNLRYSELAEQINQLSSEHDAAALKLHLAATGRADLLPRLVATQTSDGGLTFTEEAP